MVIYDVRRGMATFIGPRGQYQVVMAEKDAKALAKVLNLKFQRTIGA